MKKTISILMTAILVLLTLPFGTVTVSADPADKLYYYIADNTAIVVSCSLSLCGDLVIPATFEGYPVVAIGADAFKGCSALTSVTIPSSVTTIGDGAFYDCTGLTSAKMANGVTSIGNFAFFNCVSLTSFTIPNSITNIGEDAFYISSSSSVRFYSKKQMDKYKSLFFDASFTCLCEHEHTYTDPDDMTCEVCTYNREAPVTPALSCIFGSNVSLAAVDGCEYSCDGINWQSSSTFANLLPDTTYSFYQRFAETGAPYAKSSLSVKTNSDLYTVKGYCISGIPLSNTSIADFKSGFTTSDGTEIKVYNYLFGYHYEVTDGNIGTGMSVAIRANEVQVARYTAIIYGDVNGDGNVNSSDLLKLKRYLLNDYYLFSTYQLAANVDRDSAGKINASDLLKLKRYMLGLDTITQ